ncbi:MAG: hypothetical protein JJT81_12980 [Rubellimicrobium sp.]|nr:hypothetical protein [Rubellimicrobium sp.]
MHCILHIGSEKTGTTAIQRAAWRNRALLTSHGLALSEAAGRLNNRKFAAYFQPPTTERLYDKGFYDDHKLVTEADRQAFFRGYEDELAREFDRIAQSGRSLLLSSEFFHSRLTTPEAIGAMKHLLDRHADSYRVIVYLREQSSLARSFYSTLIKGGRTTDFAEFLPTVRPGDPYFDPVVALRPWREVFGSEALEIRLFLRDRLKGGDILQDFFGIVAPDLDTAPLPRLPKDANTALGAAALAIGRRINEAFPRYDAQGNICPTRKALMAALMSSELAQLGGTAFPEAAAIHALFDETNRRFAAEYLGQDGNPFPPPPTPDSQPIDPADLAARLDSYTAAQMETLRSLPARCTGPVTSGPDPDRHTSVEPVAETASPPAASLPGGLVNRFARLVGWRQSTGKGHGQGHGQDTDPS